MVHHALAAAATLAVDGVDLEVIDLRTLVPLDIEAVLAAVARTGRAVICQEGTLQGGVGSDIARQLYDRLFGELKAPIGVTGSAWAPIPYAPTLEPVVVAGAEAVLSASREVLGLAAAARG
jgi:pyruvate dehydrogenase E1 component beta subunit